MKVKVSEASGPALDWMVSEALGLDWYQPEYGEAQAAYSSDWAQGGPLIEQEEISTKRRMPCMKGEEWEARGSISAKGAGYRHAYGPTPLIAAMRCYVASKLGEEVDVLEELI